MAIDSPNPTTDQLADEGDAASFLPYPPIGEHLEHVPIHVRPDLNYYASRMGFLPNTLKLYMHVPWIAEHLFRINNAIMRDERNELSEHLMYRLGAIASRDNECQYCTAHHASTLVRRWGYEPDDVERLLRFENEVDEAEQVAVEFVHQASLDPTGVTDELRERLTAAFTPPQVMQIVLLVGFWRMYNTMHNAMGMALEDPVAPYSEFVNVQPSA